MNIIKKYYKKKSQQLKSFKNFIVNIYYIMAAKMLIFYISLNLNSTINNLQLIYIIIKNYEEYLLKIM